MSTACISRSDDLNIYDYRCEVGLGARPFLERHARASISFVRKGSFGYRTRGKHYELVAGSALIASTALTASMHFVITAMHFPFLSSTDP